MPRTAARPLACTQVLLFLLAVMLISSSCRAPEPPVEKSAPEKKTTLTLPAPPQTQAAPKHLNYVPEIARKNRDRPVPVDNTVPLPKPSQPKETWRPGETTKRPRIAIIIDDMGYHQQMGRQFLQLDLNLTYSFLPDAPYSGELATAAFQTGRDILVHLPMEPKDPGKNPGSDALFGQDSPERIRQKMARMLNAVPHAIGANNHMGSRFTEESGAMQVVIDSLKSRSFFFIDSFTTAASRGLTVARQQGVPTAPRHVFLDTVQEPQQICRQIEQLLAGAKQRGWAIGIGHPNGATLNALSQYSRERFFEVEVVGAHQLVE